MFSITDLPEGPVGAHDDFSILCQEKTGDPRDNLSFSVGDV